VLALPIHHTSTVADISGYCVSGLLNKIIFYRKSTMTTTPAVVPVTNRLIGSLPGREHRRLIKYCETVDLLFGETLCQPGQHFRHVYFPLTGFISLVSVLSDHPPLEIGLIGNEGMLGATLVLQLSAAPVRATVQGPGTALRMTTANLRRELQYCPSLLRKLKHFIYILMVQLSQTVACTHFHEIEPRLARWLLMTHDRAHRDHFHLTHEFLSAMLGVRRSSITIAAGALQQRKLIRYTRGEIHILNRTGLEAASCECYSAALKDYSRLLD
jgi:CRP-like cAMP-binding protein